MGTVVKPFPSEGEGKTHDIEMTAMVEVEIETGLGKDYFLESLVTVLEYT